MSLIKSYHLIGRDMTHYRSHRGLIVDPCGSPFVFMTPLSDILYNHYISQTDTYIKKLIMNVHRLNEP